MLVEFAYISNFTYHKYAFCYGDPCILCILCICFVSVTYALVLTVNKDMFCSATI